MATPTTPIVFQSAQELQRRLSAGETTSVELVNLFLDQIDRHNHQGLKLKAVISSMPREVAAKTAIVLDRERKEGKLRSALHGIPVIVKDVFVTDPSLGMPTTAGSAVFGTLKTNRNAPIVERLIEAGAIILAKTNMTEYCGMKSKDTPVGWSAAIGQTLSAYRRDGLEEKDQPISAGSSAGTAVGITAGFSPIGLGSETSGSNVYPASCGGLYGMKLTLGSVPVEGVFSISSSFDGVGVMARTPGDLALLTKAVFDGRALEEMPDGGIDGAIERGFEGLKVGVAKSSWGVHESLVESKWGTPEVVSEYDAAVEKLQSSGLEVVYPLEIREPETLKHDGESLVTVAYHEFSGQVANYIKNYEPSSDITSLKDIIAWNEKHPAEAMPEPHTGQTELIAAENNTMTPEKRLGALTAIRRLAGPEGIAKTMDDHGLDIVLSASESQLVTFAAWLGWPIGTVPMTNWKKNRQPYGLFALARKGREDVLLGFMEAWAGVVEGAKPPVVP